MDPTSHSRGIHNVHVGTSQTEIPFGLEHTQYVKCECSIHGCGAIKGREVKGQA